MKEVIPMSVYLDNRFVDSLINPRLKAKEIDSHNPVTFWLLNNPVKPPNFSIGYWNQTIRPLKILYGPLSKPNHNCRMQLINNGNVPATKNCQKSILCFFSNR